METTFNVVAVFQYWENYGAHDWDGKGECPQYWKAKGGHEVVVKEGLTVAEAAELGGEGLKELVDNYVNSGAEDREVHDTYYARYDLLSYFLDERSDAVVERVFEFVAKFEDEPYNSEWGHLVFNADLLDMSEKSMEWALETLKEQGRVDFSDGYKYAGFVPVTLVKEAA